MRTLDIRDIEITDTDILLGLVEPARRELFGWLRKVGW